MAQILLRRIALARQQCRLFTTRAAARQAFQLLKGRQALTLADDQWLLGGAAVLYCRLLALVARFLTAPAARARALAAAVAVLLALSALALALLLPALTRALATLARCALGPPLSALAALSAALRTTLATAARIAALRLRLGRHIVGAVAEVVELVVEELLGVTLRRQCQRGERLAGLARLVLLRLLAGFALALAAATLALLALAVARFRVGPGFVPGLVARFVGARLALGARAAGFRFLHLDAGRVEALHVAVRDLLPGHALDGLEQLLLVRRHQRDGLAATSGTPGTADAVDVVLLDVGQLVVDHMRQLVDVQAAGGDIGGHQNAHLVGLE